MKEYNASAPQAVAQAITIGGELFEVGLVFTSYKDADLKAYFEGDNEGDTAAAVLFDKLIASGRVIDSEQTFTADELKSNLPEADKAYAIKQGLLGVLFKGFPKSKERLSWDKLSAPVKYPLLAFFDSSDVDVNVTLDAPDSDHIRVHRAIKAKSFPVKFGDHSINSVYEGLDALYHALNPQAENYVNGAVPYHHRILVAGLRLGGYRELLLGK
jgi:hypothetical protein